MATKGHLVEMVQSVTTKLTDRCSRLQSRSDVQQDLCSLSLLPNLRHNHQVVPYCLSHHE